ncbi:MAG: DUF3368 domain-containing protein [Patescibacteria group bacterium]
MTVADATPLIALARIDAFDLLRTVLHKVVIPPAVFTEVVTKGAGRPGERETLTGIVDGWIRQLRPTVLIRQPYRGMHRGEIEVLSLAKYLSTQILTDEFRARERAEVEHIPWIGTLDLIRLAKASGQIRAARPLIEALRVAGFWMDDKLYQRVLEQLGEE